MTIHNQAGKDIHDNVVDAPLLSLPAKGEKGILSEQKENEVSKETASMASSPSEFS